MAEEVRRTYLGGHEVLTYQNGKLVGFDPYYVAPPPSYTHRIRTDAYSGSVYLAIPGTYFTNGEDFTMSDGYSDISGDINSGVSTKTIVPVETGATAPGQIYLSGSTNFSSEDYDTSIVSEDTSAVAILSGSQLPFGSDDWVVEAWIMPDEQFSRPPFHKPMLRSNETNADFYLDMSSNNTLTNNASRVRVYENGTNHISSNSARTFSLGTWQHMAYVRSGNSWYVFQDGVQIYTFTDTSSVPSPPEGFAIFGFTALDNQNENARYAMQDFRVTIGSDRGYPGGFTPPSSIIEKIT